MNTLDAAAPAQQRPVDDVKRYVRAILDLVPVTMTTALADVAIPLRQHGEKLQQNQIHIAVFGRVSVGKSALLNALLGQPRFTVSPLHGETQTATPVSWDAFQQVTQAAVVLIDTPGINEVAGQDRERLAQRVAALSDVVLFVVDGDLTHSELQALRQVADGGRRVLLVLNKVDRYTADERERLVHTLKARTVGWIGPQDVVQVAARPSDLVVIDITSQGREREQRITPKPDIAALQLRLSDCIQREGPLLAALNAALCAGAVADILASERAMSGRYQADQRLFRHALVKAVLCAFLPLPWGATLAAWALDGALLVSLARHHGVGDRGRRLRAVVGVWRPLLLSSGTVTILAITSTVVLTQDWLSELLVAALLAGIAGVGSYLLGRSALNRFALGQLGQRLRLRPLVQQLIRQLPDDSPLRKRQGALLSRLRPEG